MLLRSSFASSRSSGVLTHSHRVLYLNTSKTSNYKYTNIVSSTCKLNKYNNNTINGLLKTTPIGIN